MQKRFTGPDAESAGGVGSCRSIREYRKYRRVTVSSPAEKEPLAAVSSASPTDDAVRTRVRPQRRRLWTLVAPLCAVALLAAGAPYVPHAPKIAAAHKHASGRFTPAQMAASFAALEQFNRATTFLRAGQDPEAIAALRSVTDAPLIIDARTLSGNGGGRAEADPNVNMSATLMQTGSAMAQRARAAAEGNDAGTARLWLRRCRGLSDTVLHHATPSLDALTLAYSLDSYAGNAERKIMDRNEEIGAGNFDRLILTAMREQNRKRLWRTQFQPVLVAAVERRHKAVTAAENRHASEAERVRAKTETLAAQDALDAEIAADLIALYAAQRSRFAI